MLLKALITRQWGEHQLRWDFLLYISLTELPKASCKLVTVQVDSVFSGCLVWNANRVESL